MKNLEREKLKGYYKTQRYQDRFVGKKIDGLFQQFHTEIKKPKETRDVATLGLVAQQITELKHEKTFRQEFPTFSSFMKYLKKEKITLTDLLTNT